MKRRACLGAFAGAHGVRGEVKVRTFTAAPEGVAAYGPLLTEDGRRFTLAIMRVLKEDLVLARAAEIRSREEAAALSGTRLYVARDTLPAPAADEFYLDDLEGLRAFTEAGAPAGIVAALHNFGAGDIIELKDVPGAKRPLLLPFTRECVRVIDIAGDRLVISDAAFRAAGGEEG